VCLAVPGRLRDIETKDGLLLGTVDFGGVRKQVCFETLPGARPGDWVLVHAGFALQKIDEAAAREIEAWTLADGTGRGEISP
jgi:hydrogenase expression/formation protein HypC